MALTYQANREDKFRINLIKGQIAKEMVRSLLEKSGYRIYAFGYESLLSQMRYDVKNRQSVPENDSNNRLRSTPDLMSYDDEKRQTHFIEVKFSGAKSSGNVRLFAEKLQWYQKYWSDSIIIIVIPADHIFYAQEIQKLRLDNVNQNGINYFDLEKDFHHIETLFEKIHTSDIEPFYDVLERFKMIPFGQNRKDST